MWRDPRIERDYLFPIYCPEHGLCENLETPPFLPIRKCKICNSIRRFFSCQETGCGFYVEICPNCYANSSEREKSRSKTLIPDYNNVLRKVSQKHFVLIFVLPLIFVVVAFYFNKSAGIQENDNVTIIKKLKKNYPTQKNETWCHFLSVLDKEIPSVKSITFLHRKDKGTYICLTKELVVLYTRNKNLKSEDITFANFEAEDYGFVLEHYHAIVQKFRILITDLNKISGNVARIFHSLCDEVSSDIKPSLFIFLLKYNERTENLKPVERATSVLREVWNDLPENELAPLLSRIVKNVVDIMPEHKIHC